MRTKRFVTGLNNNQRIRVICDGVGFVTTVAGAFDMAFHHQRVAVTTALVSLGCDQHLPEGSRPTGFGTRMKVYNGKGEQVFVDVQVDLL